jgi:hypothetical protein
MEMITVLVLSVASLSFITSGFSVFTTIDLLNFVDLEAKASVLVASFQLLISVWFVSLNFEKTRTFE